MTKKRSVDDESVARELRAYQAALEAGDEPDRGELLARFPDLAEELAGCLDGLDLMYQVAPQLHEERSPDVDLGPDAALGDFRILREVGRGGMGVVYEAEQISLDRRVALKVLPFAAVLDSRYLQRFKNEAQAAAHLHHTNIVPVHAVGSERGVHYYAMQFIEGPTVAGLIDELRGFRGNGHGRDSSPALAAIAKERTTETPLFCRAVARLGIQAAEALDYAHESGIVHRDIKPPNLIVDGNGHLWITDFGLASTRNDTGLTVTGDLVGTVRYMSPEQTLGGRAPIDHRTDIYSLAVTLYELLTLQPAFPGQDAPALIRDIGTKEPTTPRALNPATPPELETILFKAMAKDPADRYANAQEFADDLRRFTEDHPIHARRPSILKRAAQWSRRHKTVVRAAVVVLVLAVLGLTAGTILLARAHDREKTARARAQRNFETVREVVDRMLTRLSHDLIDLPHMETLRRDLLEEALAYQLDFLKQTADDPGVRADAAAAHARVGNIHRMLGDYESGRRAQERAVALYRTLLADFPGRAAYRRDLGAAWGDLGHNLLEVGRYQDAEDAFRSALSVLAGGPAAPARDAAYLHTVATCQHGLALVLSDAGKSEAGRAAFVRATAAWERLLAAHPERRFRLGLANTLMAFAQRLELPADFAKAEKMALRYLDLNKELRPQSNPAADRVRTANGWFVLGNVYFGAKKHVEAERAWLKAIPIYERLSSEFPSTPLYAASIGKLCGNLAGLHRDTGEIEKRRQALLRARRIYRELAEQHGDVPAYRYELARSHYFLAEVHAHLREAQPAREECAKAIELAKTIEIDRVEWKQRWESADARLLLAKVLLAPPDGREPDHDALGRAEALLVESIAMAESMRRDAGPERSDLALRKTQASARRHLGLLYRKRGRHPQSEREFERAIEIHRERLKEDPDDVESLYGLAACWDDIRSGRRVAGRPQAAKEALEKAMEAWERAAAAHPRPDIRMGLARALLAHAQGLGLPKHFEEAREVMRRYMEIVTEVRAEDASPLIRRDEGNGWWVIGFMNSQVGHHAEAIAAYEKSIDVFDALTREFREDADYARRLGHVCDLLAGLYTNQREFEKGKALALRAHAIRARQAEEHGDVPQYRYEFARSLVGVARRRLREGDPAQATNDCRRAVEIFEELEPRMKSRVYWFDRAGACQFLAYLIAMMRPGPRELARSDDLLREGIAIHARLWKTYPDETASLEGLADLNHTLAAVRGVGARYDDAAKTYREALRWSRLLIEKRPHDRKRRRALRVAMYRGLGGLFAGRDLMKEAEAVFREGVEVEPELKHDLSLARMLRADAPIEDVRKATTLIKATPGLKGSVTWWCALGRAYYRHGDFRKAGMALGKAIARTSDPNVCAWLFTAMVHAKLGNKGTARRWYTKATTWLDQFKPTDATLQRYRAEAAALIKGTD